MDVHFWDWIIWLASKEAHGQPSVVTRELAKMHRYLTGPLGVTLPASSIAEAVSTYRIACSRAETLLAVQVDKRLSREALRWLTAAGYTVEGDSPRS